VVDDRDGLLILAPGDERAGKVVAVAGIGGIARVSLGQVLVGLFGLEGIRVLGVA
jgi:hypothetical protein